MRRRRWRRKRGGVIGWGRGYRMGEGLSDGGGGGKGGGEGKEKKS